MFRHGCSYRMVNRGVDIRVIQDWFGQQNIQHTLRYDELSPHRLRGAFQDEDTELVRPTDRSASDVDDISMNSKFPELFDSYRRLAGKPNDDVQLAAHRLYESPQRADVHIRPALEPRDFCLFDAQFLAQFRLRMLSRFAELRKAELFCNQLPGALRDLQLPFRRKFIDDFT
jgi:hypothetical protein